MVAEDDVLRDRERLDEPEVLVHHPDTGVEGVARGVEVHQPAVEEDLALVGPVEPRQDVRERALAGAVLAEERVHLARGGVEVDVLVRDHAGKALGDPAHGHGRSRRGAARAPPLLATQLGVRLPHTYLPVALPITPFTSQFIAYRSFTVSFLPAGTRELPASGRRAAR